MTNESKSKDMLAIKLFAVIMLAFAAALLFRRSAGILAMTPLMLILCGASAFISLSVPIKCAIFGITAFALNSLELPSARDAILFAALCILPCALFGYTARLIKKKKGLGTALFCISAVLCVGLNIFFIGNPFSAYKAQQRFDEYTQRIYPENENATLGKFEFSKVYYRYDTKAYVIDAVSDKYPTESASLSLGDDVICDGFKSIMEQKISEQYVAKMAAALRKAFPDGDFEVSYERFISLPGEAILSSADGELNGNVCYEIYLSGIQTGEDMLKTTRAYINAIDESGVGYARLTFKSGIGNWQRRYISIDPNHPLFHPEAELNYTNTATTNHFREYLLRIEKDK